MDYSELIKDLDNLKEVARNKGLARLGDEIINMAYSMAKSLYLGKCDGEKVNKKVLMQAMKGSGLRNLAKSRANSHDIADSAEAIIAYAVLDEKITIDSIIDLLSTELKKNNPNMNNVSEKQEADINILTILLINIKKLFNNKLPQ